MRRGKVDKDSRKKTGYGKDFAEDGNNLGVGGGAAGFGDSAANGFKGMTSPMSGGAGGFADSFKRSASGKP